MAGAAQRRAVQHARLRAAEARAFAHYGIDATSEPLVLADPPMTTRVVRVGDGPATVLLHGSGLTSTAWAPLLPHLSDRSLLLVDLPGCGLADPLDYRGIDLARHQTAFVGSVLDALGLERAALVGASMGGWFALRFAVEQPERVEAVVLLTAPAIALPGSRVPLPMALSSTRMGRVLAAAARPPSSKMTRRMLATIGGDGSVVGVPDDLFDALGAAMGLSITSTTTMELYRWRTPHRHLQFDGGQLARCRSPVLLLWGENDKVQSPAAGAWAARHLPAGRLEVLPGGHGLWFEHPELCGQLVTSFLDDAA